MDTPSHLAETCLTMFRWNIWTKRWKQEIGTISTMPNIRQVSNNKPTQKTL